MAAKNVLLYSCPRPAHVPATRNSKFHYSLNSFSMQKCRVVRCLFFVWTNTVPLPMFHTYLHDYLHRHRQRRRERDKYRKRDHPNTKKESITLDWMTHTQTRKTSMIKIISIEFIHNFSGLRCSGAPVPLHSFFAFSYFIIQTNIQKLTQTKRNSDFTLLKWQVAIEIMKSQLILTLAKEKMTEFLSFYIQRTGHFTHW